MTPTVKRMGFAALAVIASILSVYAGFVIFNTLVMVPDDPHQNLAHKIAMKLEIVAGYAVFMAAFAFLSSWAFKNRR